MIYVQFPAKWFRFALFLVVAAIAKTSGLGAQEVYNFVRLEPTYGNERVHVREVAEDGYGFIWLNCREGLMRYDGEQYTYHAYDELFGTPGGNASDLHSDDRGNLWLTGGKGQLIRISKEGTVDAFHDRGWPGAVSADISSIVGAKQLVWFGDRKGNIWRFDYGTERIEHMARLPDTADAPQEVRNMAPADSGRLWISSDHGRIYGLLPESRDLREITAPEAEARDPADLAMDDDGRLWIGTALSGLFVLDSANATPKAIPLHPPVERSARNALILTLHRAQSGNIWIGTDGDGLYRVDPESNAVRNFMRNGQNSASLSGNTIVDIFEDSKQNLWFVDKKGNVNVLPYIPNQIQYHPGTASGGPVKALTALRARNGDLYIGTDGEGLHRQTADGREQQFGPTSRARHRFPGKFIQSLTEDAAGRIWVGTYLNGLWRFDPSRERFTEVLLQDEAGRDATDVRTLLGDHRGRIWVGSDVGLHVFDASGRLAAHFQDHDNGVYGGISQSMHEDECGRIWVALNRAGLFELEEKSDRLDDAYFHKRIYHQAGLERQLNMNVIGITSSGPDSLWILTVSGRLIYMNPSTGFYEDVTERQPLNDPGPTSIESDDSGRLWLGSNRGLLRYDPGLGTAQTFYRSDGLQSNAFFMRSSYRDSDGRLYFGTDQGLHHFAPDEICKKELAAELHITRIEVLNLPGHRLLPEQFVNGVSGVQSLRLGYDQASFSFQFSALRNVLYAHFRYAYRLRGFDDDWIVDDRNIGATYTNIPPGEYDFEVRASSRGGEWDVPTRSIHLSISPPWWRSGWAYFGYALLALALLSALGIWLRLRDRLARQAWTGRKEREMYMMKMNFFAKMSHEIQTPLTLILGPIEDMLARTQVHSDHRMRRQLRLVANNARRLSRIALELATLRKKELNKLRIHPRFDDLIEAVREIGQSFEDHARARKVGFDLVLPAEPAKLWFDGELMEHILYNLLSNAFKFTPPGGNVTLSVKPATEGDRIDVSVVDTGKGIPTAELDRIFQLNYQTELGQGVQGNGIGLALVKEIVELHHGDIRVESSPAGSRFTITLSTAADAFAEVLPERNGTGVVDPGRARDFSDVASAPAVPPHPAPKEHSVLIVEDNPEMQYFLQQVFEEYYFVHLAGDGGEGVALARKILPDLIVSDVIMPGVDGIEMSRALAKEPLLAHIPIILLSAQNEQELKLRGLRSGAVEYLGKPFNVPELLIKARNVIERRERVIGRYRTEQASHPKPMEGKSPDEQFLEKLTAAIIRRLDGGEAFQVEDLASDFSVSYSALYRRCQSLTGKSIVDFTRLVRLRRGASLILQRGYRVSEAAYQAGFSSSKYFSRCFRKEFGLSPNAMRKEAEASDLEAVLRKYDLSDEQIVQASVSRF